MNQTIARLSMRTIVVCLDRDQINPLVAPLLFLINNVIKKTVLCDVMLAGWWNGWIFCLLWCACNKSIRPSKERSKEASFGCESV